MLRRQFTVSALACAVLLSAIPAQAQYYGGPYREPPAYDDEDDDDDRRPRRYYRRDYGYERPQYRQRYNNICVTSRGDCPTPPLPRGAPCSCYIPGFGNKRGAVP